MPLPVEWSTRTVVGEWPRLTGTSTGTVTFVPTGSPWRTVAGKTVPPEAITADLVDGAISIAIPTTDDPDVSPVGGTWTVHEVINGVARPPYAIQVPTGSGSLNLATLARVSPVGAVERLVRTVDGIAPDDTGNVNLPSVGDSPVTSVDGRTGAVTLGDRYVDPTALATKAGLVHSHVIGDVTGLGTSLASKATKPVVRSAYLTHRGNGEALPNTGGLWAPLAGFELSIPAEVGDWVELSATGMRNANANALLDIGVIVGSDPPTIRRFLATGTNSPALEGDPAFYTASTFPAQSGPRGITVTLNELDGGNVRFAVVLKCTGQGLLFATSDYPFYWQAKNLGVVA